MEREQLRTESTLIMTVKSSDEFRDDVTDGIEALERGETVALTSFGRCDSSRSNTLLS